MNALLKKAYDKLPVSLQNGVLTAFSAILDRERYSGEFTTYRKLLADTEWWDASALRDYQDQRLRLMVRHAYETVPYYRKKFDHHGVSPESVQTQEDLNKLPLLTRKDVIDNFDDLRSRAFRRGQLKLGHTSGTTGSPLEILYDSGMVNMTYAVLDRQYQWAGAKLMRFGDRVALLRGNVVVPISQNKPPFWRHNRYHNHLLLSSFHLSANNLASYVSELQRFAPKIIDGYPSTVYVLANYLLANGLRLPVHAVLTSSETLFDFQRAAIEEAFACKIFDYFGAAERVVFAAECEKHSGHHLMSEFGITEVVDSEHKSVSTGESGFMVGTSLHNLGMPMIRYQCSDVTALKTGACPCGRAHPLMEDIATKSEDILALRDGRMISPSVLTHPFKPMHTVTASQIIQNDYDHITIKVVPGEGYGDADTQHLVREFKARLGDSVKVEIELVDDLPRTKSGKFKWVVSKVDKAIRMPDDA